MILQYILKSVCYVCWRKAPAEPIGGWLEWNLLASRNGSPVSVEARVGPMRERQTRSVANVSNGRQMFGLRFF